MNHTVFQFSKALKESNIPVITLMNNNKKFNFIVDTGSSTSAINRDALEEMSYQMLSDVQESVGIEGIKIECEMCAITFTHENDPNVKFIDIMSIVDMNSALDYLEVTDNMVIHGLLGSSFLMIYKGVLDYENNTMSLVKYRSL